MKTHLGREVKLNWVVLIELMGLNPIGLTLAALCLQDCKAPFVSVNRFPKISPLPSHSLLSHSLLSQPPPTTPSHPQPPRAGLSSHNPPTSSRSGDLTVADLEIASRRADLSLAPSPIWSLILATELDLSSCSFRFSFFFFFFLDLYRVCLLLI